MKYWKEQFASLKCICVSVVYILQFLLDSVCAGNNEEGVAVKINKKIKKI